ncbi:hypothetical protein FACS1894105_14460 [Clostridia bacterium]|nr:hypothetical protein FACS1894105_14460 [Clostridia bacterium]
MGQDWSKKENVHRRVESGEVASGAVCGKVNAVAVICTSFVLTFVMHYDIMLYIEYIMRLSVNIHVSFKGVVLSLLSQYYLEVIIMVKIVDCITDVFNKMSDDEKGLLRCVIEHGEKMQEKAGDIINSPKELKEYGERLNILWIVEEINNKFVKGTGFMDTMNELSDNYGKQLDVTISEVLVKSLKVQKPIFSKSADTIDGAMQRENWIAEKLMDSMIKDMDEETKKAFANQVSELLKEQGVSVGDATKASSALLVGGLTTAKAVLGFQFHILVAQIANMLVKALVGRGLSLAANAALQRFVGFLFGPVGWVITILTTLPLITSLFNPREYDKFIPAVFIIGISRISQNSNSK